MNNELYIIKRDSLVNLADLIRSGYGLSNEEGEKTELSLTELKEVLDKINNFREIYLTNLQAKGSGTFYLPREIMNVGSLPGLTNATHLYLEEGRDEINFENGSLESSKISELIIPKEISKITFGNYSFSNSQIKELSIPEGNKDITFGQYSFQKSLLENLSFPETSSKITFEDYCFSQTRIKEITFPENSVFSSPAARICERCTLLEAVHWKAVLISKIPQSCFTSANINLFDITPEAAEKILEIGGYAFQNAGDSNTGLKMNFSLLKNLQKIYDFAFDKAYLYPIDENGETTTLLLPNTLTSIGQYAFRAARMTKLYLPKNIVDYGWQIFQDCTKLEEVELDPEIDAFVVPSGLFGNCSSLKKIINAEAIVQTVGDCFYNCQLTETPLFENLATIDSQSFANVKTTVLYLPKLTYCNDSGLSPFYDSQITELAFGTLLGSGLPISENRDTNDITKLFFSHTEIDTIKFYGTLEEWVDRRITSVDADFPFMKTKTDADGNTVYDQLYVLNEEGEFIIPRGTRGSSLSTDVPYILDSEIIRSNVFYGYKNFGAFQFSNKLKTIEADAFKNAVVTSGTGKDRIRFDMTVMDYIGLDFENPYSSIFSAARATSAVLIKYYDDSGEATFRQLNMSFSDSYLEKEDGTYPTKITFNPYVLANLPSGNINVGGSKFYTENSLEIEFKDNACYQCSEFVSDNKKSGSALLTFGTGVKSVIVGNRSFYNSNRLSAIKTTAPLISIGEEAFYGCVLLYSAGEDDTVFSLPIIETIGNGAFYGCSSMAQAVLGSEGHPITSIGENAFYGCTHLENLTIYFDTTLYTDPSEMENYPWGLVNTNIHGPIVDGGEEGGETDETDPNV